MRKAAVRKYIFKEAIFALFLYYFILVVVAGVNIFIFKDYNGLLNQFEFMMVIMFFTFGVIYLGDNVHFIRGFNLSRGTYFKGMIEGIIPVLFIGSIIEVLIANFLEINSSFIDLLYEGVKNTILIGAGSDTLIKFSIFLITNFLFLTIGVFVGSLMSIVSKRAKAIILGGYILVGVLFAIMLDRKIFVFKDVFAILSFQGEVIFISMFVIIISVMFYLSNKMFKKSI